MTSTVLLYNTGASWSEEEVRETLEAVEVLWAALNSAGHRVEPVEVQRNLAEALTPFPLDEYLVFNWCEELEGVHTSEPLVPARLDLLGYRYTGSGYWTLATAQDKALTKALLRGYEVPTLRGRIYEEADPGDWSIFPAIVKASRQHASEAITPQAVVTSPEELRSRLTYVIETYHEPALVEEFVTGREFRVCILDGEAASVLPLVELDYSQLPDPLERLATYEAKFVPGSRHHEAIEIICPAEVDSVLEARIKQVALRAYRALRCQDYGKVDIRVRDGVPYVLDVNPNPDITLETSFDYASEEAGMDYPALVDHIVRSALRRERRGVQS